MAMTPITQRNVWAAAFIGLSLTTTAPAQATRSLGMSALPSDADVRKMLAERVETLAGKEDGVGIVIGLIGPQGRRIISYGHLNQGDARSVDGNTCFEIGSVTKVFTALLLADMVRKGEVGLEDQVAEYLPAGVKLPGGNDRSITLLELATHTSGLPFMPDEFADTNDSAVPTQSATQLYKFLARYQFQPDSVAKWAYSNIGYWLLSEALSSRAGMEYESLLKTRVIGPLKLASTAFDPSPKMKTNLAVGHNAALQPTPSFSSMPIYREMLAAGGLVSTANDMLTFLAAITGHEQSPPPITSMLKTHRSMPAPGKAQALGWVMIGEADDQLIVSEGGTWGYASSVAWDPKMRVGVVVLSNQVASVEDIALHLLRPSVPLSRPTATKHTEISLDSAILDTYSGRYEARGEGVFIVTHEGDFLTIQVPADWGLPKLHLRPEGPRDFFTSELPMRVTVETGSDGRVNGLLVYPPRGQQAIHVSRMAHDR